VVRSPLQPVKHYRPPSIATAPWPDCEQLGEAHQRWKSPDRGVCERKFKYVKGWYCLVWFKDKFGEWAGVERIVACSQRHQCMEGING
jgi:hypothetical protein